MGKMGDNSVSGIQGHLIQDTPFCPFYMEHYQSKDFFTIYILKFDKIKLPTVSLTFSFKNPND